MQSITHLASQPFLTLHMTSLNKPNKFSFLFRCLPSNKAQSMNAKKYRMHNRHPEWGNSMGWRVILSESGQENKAEPSTAKERRIPAQSTQSFKGEKKKRQNWFQRQFSKQMRQDTDFSNGIEHPTAVAAAAFAIRLFEESSIIDQKVNIGRPDSSTKLPKTRTMSQKQSENQDEGPDGMDKPVDLTPALKKTPTFADKKSESQGPNKAVGSTPSMKKTTTFADQKTESQGPEKAVGPPPGPSIKKTPTFADKQSESAAGRKPAFPPTELLGESSKELGMGGNTQADAWEKEELAKIEEKYTKLGTTILEWENKRKTKAKRKINRTDAKLDEKRAKARKHYNGEMKRIDEIAEGARAQAEKNRRNEEFKVKEKANKIRTTGKLPSKCLCF